MGAAGPAESLPVVGSERRAHPGRDRVATLLEARRASYAPPPDSSFCDWSVRFGGYLFSGDLSTAENFSLLSPRESFVLCG